MPSASPPFKNAFHEERIKRLLTPMCEANNFPMPKIELFESLKRAEYSYRARKKMPNTIRYTMGTCLKFNDDQLQALLARDLCNIYTPQSTVKFCLGFLRSVQTILTLESVIGAVIALTRPTPLNFAFFGVYVTARTAFKAVKAQLSRVYESNLDYHSILLSKKPLSLASTYEISERELAFLENKQKGLIGFIKNLRTNIFSTRPLASARQKDLVSVYRAQLLKSGNLAQEDKVHLVETAKDISTLNQGLLNQLENSLIASPIIVTTPKPTLIQGAPQYKEISPNVAASLADYQKNKTTSEKETKDSFEF